MVFVVGRIAIDKIGLSITDIYLSIAEVGNLFRLSIKVEGILKIMALLC